MKRRDHAPGRSAHRAERCRAERCRGEEGSTLIELVVAMALSTLLLAMLVATTTTFDHSLVKQANVARSATGVQQAVLAMDKQVRYADAVNTPGGSPAAWWVEYDWLKATSAGPQAWCSQWKASAAGLQMRQWSVAAGFSSATTWRTFVAALGTTTTPFALVTATATTPLTAQQLTLTLSPAAGASAGTAATTQVTLTALNSATNTAPTTPVCQAPTSRT